jgi:hypothetical protein
LEDVENAGYTRALTDRMKTVPALAGREESIAADIVSRTKQLIDDELAARAESGVSDSERTHIKTAALRLPLRSARIESFSREETPSFY